MVPTNLLIVLGMKNVNTKLMDVEDPLKDEEEVDVSQTLASELLNLFSGELNPVAPKAQKKVPVPEG